MKRILLYIRQIFIIVFLLLCFQNEAISQNNDTIKGKDTTKRIKPGLFIGGSIGLSQTSIKCVGTLAVSQLASSSRSSYLGSLEVGYFFSKYLGLSSGFSYVSYKSQLTLANYQNNFSTTDSEKDVFEMRVTGSNIKELQTVDVLSIPLCVNLRVPFSKQVGLYFKGGVNLAFPLSQKYSSSGTFTYKGFYPAYNDLLENLPAYGFPTNKSLAVDGQLKLKTMGVNMIASGGLDFFIKKKMQIALGVSFSNTSLGVKDGSTSMDKFQLSPDAEHINSFVGGSSKTTAKSMGVEFTFRYFL